MHQLVFLLTVIAAVEDTTHIKISLRGDDLVPPFVLSRGEVFQYLTDPRKRLTPQGTETFKKHLQ